MPLSADESVSLPSSDLSSVFGVRVSGRRYLPSTLVRSRPKSACADVYFSRIQRTHGARRICHSLSLAIAPKRNLSVVSSRGFPERLAAREKQRGSLYSNARFARSARIADSGRCRCRCCSNRFASFALACVHRRYERGLDVILITNSDPPPPLALRSSCSTPPLRSCFSTSSSADTAAAAAAAAASP